MKIAIYTQPLLNNYGGILQNYALQKVLVSLGHEPITIDHESKVLVAPLWICILSWIKNLLLLFIPGHKSFFFNYPTYMERKKWSSDFVKKHIVTTEQCIRPKKKILEKHDINAIIVGSDQVWRPKMNNYLEDCFLAYTAQMAIKRIAYAVSFGTSEWEMTKSQEEQCTKLAAAFDTVSVREDSGVKLCMDHLNLNADFVLDPTLLLHKEDYCEICKDIPQNNEKVLVAYILDITPELQEWCKRIANEKGLVLKYFTSDNGSSLSVSEWIAMFRDASYIVTDSFHGTVFSIIFEKKFECVHNKERGAARFETLLRMYNSDKLNEMRLFSLNWLKNALES